MDGLTLRAERLGTLPTPLHRHRSLEAVLGLDELWVKRDDLTGYAWGGNKVRPVEYLVHDALDSGATTVVMASGPSSNFAATMTAAATAAGLAVEQICYGGQPQSMPAALRASLANGAVVRFTGSDDRSSMDRVAEIRADALVKAGHRPYVTPRGGASAIGTLGFLNAAIELNSQLTDVEVRPATIVVAVGSGGSIAGLAAGNEMLGADWNLIGVSVSRPPDELTTTIGDHAVACADAAGLAIDAIAPPRIVDGRGRGFGVASRHELAVAATIERRCGLLVDPVYTGKTLCWLAEAQLSGPVLYWHTGGTLGVVDRLMSS